MAFDLHITVTENSLEAHVIQKVAEDSHISPEQAAQRLFEEAVRAHLEGEKTPAQNLIGAFSSEEGVAAIDEAMAVIHAQRPDYDRVRDLGF